MIQRLLVRIWMLFAVLLWTVSIASAQSAGTKAIPAIRFPRGAHTTVIDGTVSAPVTVGPDMTDDGSERYSLQARSGQVLTIEMSSDNQQALFSLIKPSPARAKNDIVERAGAVKRWSGRLTESGNYLVQVFTHGRESASHFKLRVTLH
jgi:hypothetical protein